MQASKIIPGKVYAVKRGNELLRFRVNEVTTITRRKRGEKANPHDHTSTIEGFFEDTPLSGAESTPGIKTVSPDDIQGEFSQYTELVERKKQEQEAHERELAAKRAAARELAVALYALIGQEPPAVVEKRKGDVFSKPTGTESYESLFRSGYDNVDIKVEGVAALLPIVQALIQKRNAA